jgi:hypothetical protein
MFPGFEFLRQRRCSERRQQSWPHKAATDSHHGCSGSHLFMIVGEKSEINQVLAAMLEILFAN